ncbi:MAG TPA: hypothetical protein VG125_17720, partial [Pirellulales bacterium]|nr:hypothetical protein [Pirellulales bacterium]
WFRTGCKRDVPCTACYIGHYNACGKECYVWVEPEGRGALAEFTLVILNLSSIFQETQIVTAPTGIQFSPALTRSPR